MRSLLSAILATFLTAGIVSVSAQNLTFSVKREEVRIDVLVTDDGKPVTGIRASDFEVRDNGVQQTIQSASFQEIPASVILVLDMSGSGLVGRLIDHLKRAGFDLLDKLREGERAALITFNHAVTLNSTLTPDLQNVRQALDRTQPRSFGKTSLIDASYAGLIHAESKADQPLIIVFSDGLDTSSWLTDEAVLESARRSDAVIYAVSAGRLPDRTFLRELTNTTGGFLVEIESTDDLGSVFVDILEEFRQRYLLTYSPTGVGKAGWHELEVKVKNHRYDKISARKGYMR
ncbi:MAG: VWA domain-containing protein [Acidobacteria bacterium]|nr:VWA domain-containing protein [Acidobacteriota bacterium]